MNKKIMIVEFDDIELTNEEKRQCGIIKTKNGVIRIMPPSVMEKLRQSFWKSMESLRFEDE